MCLSNLVVSSVLCVLCYYTSAVHPTEDVYLTENADDETGFFTRFSLIFLGFLVTFVIYIILGCVFLPKDRMECGSVECMCWLLYLAGALFFILIIVTNVAFGLPSIWPSFMVTIRMTAL